jgi:hypothetical protein
MMVIKPKVSGAAPIQTASYRGEWRFLKIGGAVAGEGPELARS